MLRSNSLDVASQICLLIYCAECNTITPCSSVTISCREITGGYQGMINLDRMSLVNLRYLEAIGVLCIHWGRVESSDAGNIQMLSSEQVAFLPWRKGFAADIEINVILMNGLLDLRRLIFGCSHWIEKCLFLLQTWPANWGPKGRLNPLIFYADSFDKQFADFGPKLINMSRLLFMILPPNSAIGMKN